MMNPNVKYTYQDYINLPESEEKRYELIDGELYMVPSPSTIHQFIQKKLLIAFDQFVAANDSGTVLGAPLDVVLSNTDVLQPDILFISNGRASIITDQNIQGAPDLVIEIISPGTADRDRTIKRARYAKFGVREYWLVDPQCKTVEVLQASQTGFDTVRVYPEGTSAASTILEGLEVAVTELFV